MGRRIAAKITGVAGYVPPRVVTNFDLEKMVDTNDEWIRTRTGIRERHYAEPGVGSSHLGAEAAKKLLADKRVDPRRDRSHRGGNGYPGHAVPRHGLLDSRSLGRKKRLGFRSLRCVFRICLRAHRGGAVCRRRNAQKGLGYR